MMRNRMGYTTFTLYTRVTSTFGLLYVDAPLWPQAVRRRQRIAWSFTHETYFTVR